MVFSSVPAVYLDPPNWPHNQQGAEQHQRQSIMNITNNIMSTNTSSLHHLPPPPPPHRPTGCGGPGLIRPGSMVDRARLARLPLPEAGLKCPRCESTNTKFCYFNNYSLSQPRHFCKTCRRYWTRGGALRSVPVGGGCRRNKRSSKSSSSSSSTGSKSPISLHRRPSSSTNGTGSTRGLFSGAATASTALKNFTAANLLPPTPTQLPFLPSLQGLNHDHVTGGFGGLNLGAVAGDMEFQMGLSSAAGLSRVQQQQHYFHSLAGLDSGLYPFQHGGSSSTHHHDVDHGGGSGGVEPTMMGTAAADEVSGGGGIMQDDSSRRVKSEDSSGHLGLNLSHNLLGIQENNSDTGGADQLGHDQYNRWSTTTTTAGAGAAAAAAAGNEWTDLSVFSSSSSTSHLM